MLQVPTTLSITNSTTAGAEGGSATTSVISGLCKMWAHLSGSGTPAIDDSLNTSSVTDVSTGRRRINISNDLDNVTYSVMSGMIQDGNSGSSRGAAGHHLFSQTAALVEYGIVYGSDSGTNGALSDSGTEDGVSVFGDLA